MKNYTQFLKENVNKKNPIVIKSKKNDLFYINIFFDNNGKVDKIENKWDVKLPEWYGFGINEIEINNWIRKVEPDLYIENSITESTSKIAFDDEIKFELKRYLEGTIFGKMGQTEERASQLIDLHKNFIEKARNKMSADEIAKKLYEYQKNLNK